VINPCPMRNKFPPYTFTLTRLELHLLTGGHKGKSDRMSKTRISTVGYNIAQGFRSRMLTSARMVTFNMDFERVRMESYKDDARKQRFRMRLKKWAGDRPFFVCATFTFFNGNVFLYVAVLSRVAQKDKAALPYSDFS